MKLRTMAMTAAAILMLGVCAAAEEISTYDPIDKAFFGKVDGTGFYLYGAHEEETSAKVYEVLYDDNDRLVSVKSAPVKLSSSGPHYFSYADLGFSGDILNTNSKLLLWSEDSGAVRPAYEYYKTPNYFHVSDYDTAENNPTMVVKRVIEKTDEDGNPEYIVVGTMNGGIEVRYTIREHSVIAKVQGAFVGRDYNADEIWRYDDTNGKLPTDILTPGDIVGIDNQEHVFMIMVDAEELISGVKSGEVPEIYNMYNSINIIRDSFVTGPVSLLEYDNGYGYITAAEKRIGIDGAWCADIVSISEDNSIALNADGAVSIYDMKQFDDETKKGDYVYARYANKGVLQEVYIYRFE